MKKLVSILLALAMILSLSINVLADELENNEVKTYEVTFNGILGHTYEMFQIFVGDVATENGKLVLSNAKYGQNFGTKDAEVDPDDMARFENSTALAEFMKEANLGTPYATINVGGSLSTTTMDVPGGYYVIRDITAKEDMPEGQTDSLVILQVMGEVTITSKHATITSTKKTFDFNDSTDTVANSNPVDSADYDIGDAVPFQLTIKLPATMPSYNENYDLTIHDQQADGLTLDEASIKIYILKADGNTKINITDPAEGLIGHEYFVECDHNEASRQTCAFGEDCTFCIRISDINSYYAGTTFADGDQLIIEYESELNEHAITGREGNINGMYVCHPDGHTTEDYVTILTYEIDITKVDGATNEHLHGAEFELYKWIATENENQGGWTLVDTLAADDNLALFTWEGLDGGKYKLVETDTPKGYNSIKPIEFVIDANHKETWDNVPGYSAFTEVNAMAVGGGVVIAAADNNGVLEGNVANHKGAILPETGAEGTLFLITGGTLLVIVACVFMITRKKMSIYED